MVDQHQTRPGQEFLTTVLLPSLSISVVNRMKDCTDVLLTMALVIQSAEMSSLLFNVSSINSLLSLLLIVSHTYVVTDFLIKTSN